MTSLVRPARPAAALASRLAAVALALSVAFAAASAQSADERYFKGKVFTVVVQSKPGGGTDTTARLVSRYWGKYIPGRPDVLVRNKPEGIIAANDLQHRTRPDGLTVGVFAGGNSLGAVARKDEAVRYDPRTWGHVGAIERGSSIIFIRKSALPRLKDKGAAPVAVGTINADRPQDAMAVFAGEYADWNIKFVLGYPSSNDVYLAFERGEIDMFASGTSRILDRFVKEGGAVLLVAETRRSDYPEVPTFEQYLGPNKPDGVAWRTFQAWAGPSAVDKFFATPPNTPAEILNTLRASFVATTEDADFKGEAKNILGEGYVVESGEDTLATINAVLDIPQEVVALTRKLREKHGLPIGKALQ